MESGVELPYSFEEHTAAGRPSLYEYRPLVRTFVEARADRLVTREDAKIAVEELRREPAAAIFARAHAGVKPTEEEALLRTVLMPLLTKTAEACGGFDWDDGAFDHAYCELEQALSPQATEPRDAPAELADAVTALRLATAAPVAAGPVLFERLDWRPFGVRPVLPIAATQPTGEPSRLDSF